MLIGGEQGWKSLSTAQVPSRFSPRITIAQLPNCTPDKLKGPFKIEVLTADCFARNVASEGTNIRGTLVTIFREP